MNILATEVNLKYGAFEIYVSGCTRECCGCHNYESWDFTKGTPYAQWYYNVFSKRNIPSFLIGNIWVLGGEPLDQDPDDLFTLFTMLREDHKDKKLWLWTSYELANIPVNILGLLDFVKTGKYCQHRPSIVDQTTSIPLASDNQKIIRLH